MWRKHLAQQPQPKKDKKPNRILAISALCLTASGVAGFFYGKYFLEQKLSPLIQAELQKSLNRPVTLGGVDRFSWNGVRFGQTTVPSTESQQNFVVAEAIDIQVDVWQYFQTQQIGVSVTVVKPQVFWRQDFTNLQNFLSKTPAQNVINTGNIDLKAVKIEDANVSLQSISTPLVSASKAIAITRLNLQSEWQLTNPQRQAVQLRGEGKIVNLDLQTAKIPTSAELRQAISAQSDNGTLRISKAEFNLNNGEGGIQLQAQDLGLAAFNGFSPDFPAAISQGKANGSVAIGISPNSEIDVQGNVRVRDVDIKVKNLPQSLKNISGDVQFNGESATIQGISGSYGALTWRTKGGANLQSGLNLDVAIEVPDIAKALTSLELKPPVPINGAIKLEAKLIGKAPRLTANFVTTQPISIDHLIIDQFQAQIESTDAKLVNIRQIQSKSATAGNLTGSGSFIIGNASSLKFNLAVANINSDAIAKLYNAKLPIPIGKVAARVQVKGITQILASFQAPQALFPTAGAVEIFGNTATLRNTKIRLPSGELGLTGAIFLDGKHSWQLQLTSNGVPLSTFPNLIPNLSPNQNQNQNQNQNLPDGKLFGWLKLSSVEGSFLPQKISANGNLNIQLRAIEAAISGAVVWNGRDLQIPQLRFGDYLSGNGSVAFDSKLIPQKINLKLRSPLRQPLKKYQTLLYAANANFAKNAINQENQGSVDFDAEITGAPNQLKLLTKIRLEDLDIPELIALGVKINPESELNPLIPHGKFGFAGEIRGIIDPANISKFNPRIQGIVKLVDLRLNRQQFDPLIAGKFSFNLQNSPEILVLDLHGKTDLLALSLDSKFVPIGFNLRLGTSTATGIRLASNPQSLVTKIRTIPLSLVGAIFNRPKLIDGNLSSDLVISFKDQNSKNQNSKNQIQALGDVTISKPRFGRAQAEKLSAKINFANGDLTLSNGILNISSSPAKYGFELAYTPAAATTLQGKINIETGTVKEILNFLQLESPADIANVLNPPQYGKAEVLSKLPKIKSEQTLYEQLQYFAQIKARKDQQEILIADSNNNLPAFSEFNGGIEGEVKFAIPEKGDLKLGFNLSGKAWDYGKFAIDDIKVKGNYNQGILTFDTARLQTGDRLGQIVNAKISLRDLEGRVELANFPIESLRPLAIFNALPVDVTGFANGFANLSGGLFNPKAVGKIDLAEATINRQPLKVVGGDFDYGNGRFKFKSKIVTTAEPTAEPITIDGDIPYRFCPIPAQSSLQILCNLAGAASQAIKININVKNDGLAFINILNTPVQWLAGKGSGAIAIAGTFAAPKIQGILSLDRAAFAVAGLPGDITAVQGKVDFNFDRFKADLLGKFSQGDFTAKGVLAITNPALITERDPDFNDPLTIVAKKLNLNLKNLYAGFADGVIAVRGALTLPEVSGQIAIADGRVIVGEEPPADGRNVEKDQFNIGFNNLLVSLENNIQVTRAPLLNLLAKGRLIVNGSLSDIRPEGRVKIERGQINTISARLRLDRDFDNYAVFVASQGLNPNLNVRVIGTIPEVTRTRIDDIALNSINPINIPVSNLGAARTIQIQATVTGSVQSPNIELRSSPPRNQAEILTLLGGGLLQQGGSDPTAVLANLAGGTIIGIVQDAIGDLLDFSEFNLRPATTNTSTGNLSNIGLEAEAAISFNQRFSFAVRAVLNDPSQFTNFTFRYRASPSTLILTNTDLRGNNSISIEYESRF